METAVYNTSGKKVETMSLPESVFGLKWNPDLVHQVMEAERSNRRTHRAKVKTRGEVSGGGKKPWRQKGTGRARHGSTRSPIWVGGGVSHGPSIEKVFARKINRKMSKKAIATALSAKLKDKEIVFLDALVFDTHKTKEAVAVFKTLAAVGEFSKLGVLGGTALVLLPNNAVNAVRAVRNIRCVDVKNAGMLQVSDLLSHKFLVIPKATVSILENSLAIKSKKS